jgi:hypothetical protein
LLKEAPNSSSLPRRRESSALIPKAYHQRVNDAARRIPCFFKRRAVALFLLLKGLFFLALAVIDWLTAKTAVSERHYLLPARIVSEFIAAIRAALQGELRLPSLLACTHWNRKASGPLPPRL